MDIKAQIVFATDGCMDNTVNIIRDLQNSHKNIIHYNEKINFGRGLALKKIFNSTKG